jgi:hypothetical protein
MKLQILLVALAALISYCSCNEIAGNKPPEITAVSTQLPRAKNGEEVWVIVSYIKADKKADYEKWLKEIFFAALHKTQSQQFNDQMKQTRWLTPKGQNEDKSWTYSFLMDPVVQGGDYDIPSLLNKEYGEEKGKAYLEQYMSFMAKPGEAHILQQTNY